MLDYQTVSDSLRDTGFYGVGNIAGFAGFAIAQNLFLTGIYHLLKQQKSCFRAINLHVSVKFCRTFSCTNSPKSQQNLAIRNYQMPMTNDK
ncbi:hypothetical protein ACE1CI_14835 [Aerosakkonemataceae cyanobacterium BLCC-F50]|uniref:Uncharacterized protein n=1 Tax=Floridaenema flaviceps BLCC-F50 TaxID=3153642 RepID=A0ABV4XTD0_9CYAN